jgi:hypothetical protein
MGDAKRIVVAGYRQVLEDGPDAYDSESDSNHSGYSEELSGMYTSELFGSDGKPNLASARPIEEQAIAPRGAAQSEVAQQQRQPTRLPSDDEDSEMTEDRKRAIRSFSKEKSGKGRAGCQDTV